MEPDGPEVNLAARGVSSTSIGSASGTRSNATLTAKGTTHIVQVDLVGADDVVKSDGSSQPSTHHVASETTSARTRAAIRRRMPKHYHSRRLEDSFIPLACPIAAEKSDHDKSHITSKPSQLQPRPDSRKATG
jgi:hypothetical protein